MKKIICLALLFAMLFSGCSNWKVEIVDPTKPNESEAETSSEPEEPEVLTKIQERADKYIFEYEFRNNEWIEELSERGISVSIENRKYTGDETWEAELFFKKGGTELRIPFKGIYASTGTIYYGTVMFPDSKTAVFCGNNQAVFFSTENLETVNFEPEFPDFGKENIWVLGAGIDKKSENKILFVTPLDNFQTEDAETILLTYNGNELIKQDVTKLRGTSKDGERKNPLFYEKTMFFDYEGETFVNTGYEVGSIKSEKIFKSTGGSFSVETDEYCLVMEGIYLDVNENIPRYFVQLYENGKLIGSMIFMDPNYTNPEYSENPEDTSVAVNGKIATLRSDVLAMTLIFDFEKGTHKLEYTPDDMLVDMEQEPITSSDGKYSIYYFGRNGGGDYVSHHVSIRNNETKKHKYLGQDGGMYGSENGIGFFKNNDVYFYSHHKLEIYDPETLEIKFDIQKNFPLGYDGETDSERGLLTFRRNPEDFSYIIVYYEYENGIEFTTVENGQINYEQGNCNYKIGFLDSEGNLLESYDSGIGIASSPFGLEEANMFHSEDELKIFVSDRRDNPLFTITFDLKTKEFSFA